jgi:hypothetical protein
MVKLTRDRRQRPPKSAAQIELDQQQRYKGKFDRGDAMPIAAEAPSPFGICRPNGFMA